MKQNLSALFFPIALLLVFTISSCSEPPQNSNIITSDIDHFWEAFDKITSTQDSAQQHAYFKELFLDKGSPGLDGIMRARRYTAEEYIDAINHYPKFWASVRDNTFKAKDLGGELDQAVRKLKEVYPDLKPAKIYFTIGALRTNGTVIDSMLLIGSELAMGDVNTVTGELPDNFSYLEAFFQNNPIDNVVPLNIHEYVHTQQNAVGGYDLLSQSVFEGVAEFVPVIALDEPSSTPAIAYGKANNEKVRQQFESEMFSRWFYNWIWNDMNNEFGVRDLGYYVGYAIAEKYYEQATDKKQAIKDLIELDYQNREEIEAFVDQTGYFSKPMAILKEAYEQSRPVVTGIQEFDNGSQQVDPGLRQLTIHFSKPLDTRYRSTGLGELGREHFPTLDSISFAEDGTSVTYHVQLEPATRYQLLLEEGYRTPKAISVKPYLIDFRTAKK
jgi:hypothetical protein